MEHSIFEAMFKQVWASPACIMVIVAISIVAYVLEIWPNFNSRYINPVCILTGPCIYWLFATKGSVPDTFPYPVAVLIVNGLIAGFAASILHSKLTMWLIGKFAGQPNPQNTNQNTEPKP